MACIVRNSSIVPIRLLELVFDMAASRAQVSWVELSEIKIGNSKRGAYGSFMPSTKVVELMMPRLSVNAGVEFYALCVHEFKHFRDSIDGLTVSQRINTRRTKWEKRPEEIRARIAEYNAMQELWAMPDEEKLILQIVSKYVFKQSLPTQESE